MANETVNQEQEIEENVSQDLTDEHVDKFFENGGKEAPISHEESESTDRTSPSTENIEQNDNPAQPEEEKPDLTRNYQAAMKEERQRRQQEMAMRQELEKKVAVMEQRFQQFIHRTEQESQPSPPSYEEDPLGHQQHTIKELQDYVIQQNEYLNKQQQSLEAQQNEYNFKSAYADQAREYAGSNPEFMDAYNYLVSKKMNEYIAAGLSPQQANQQLTYEEAKVVGLAFRQGVNPAERVFAMAKASGYTKPTDSIQPKSQNENSEVSKKLEQIQKSIVANKSLSQAGGKADTKSSLSLQSIADMDDDEFDKVDWKKVVKYA